MRDAWLILLPLGGAFLLLFGLAEWLYHQQHVKAEYTRKLVHAGTGLLTLLFPIYLHGFWQVALLCLSFLVLLLASMKYSFLPSINAVERRTWGSLLYPLIVMACYLFYKEVSPVPGSVSPLFHFYAPMLVMALCDPVAALAGKKYGRNPAPNGKTAAGSIAFAVAAFLLCGMLSFLLGAAPSPLRVVLRCFLLAAATTGAERWSSRGWDNATIPLAAMLILYAETLLPA